MKAELSIDKLKVTVRGACGTQLGFIHEREPDAPGVGGGGGGVAGPGARAFARQQADRVIQSSVEPESPIKAEALERVRDELARYLSRLGVGAEFQSVDFLNDLDRRGLRPSADVLDMRATGGIFRQLVSSGVLKILGYRSNAGGNATQYNATTRPVYRIEQHWMPTGGEGANDE